MFREYVNLMYGRHTARLLMRWTHPDRTLLDIGCGSGALGYLLETEHGYRLVHNIDVADIRQFPLRRYQVCDSSALPFEDACMDMTVLAFVLHHMPPEAMLRVLTEAARVTCGHLLIIEDTPERFLDHVGNWLHGWTWRIQHRSMAGFCFRTEAQWRAIFAQRGLEVVAAERLGRLERLSMPWSRTCFVLRVVPTEEDVRRHQRPR